MKKENCYYEDNFYDVDRETRDGKKGIILVLSIFNSICFCNTFLSLTVKKEQKRPVQMK